jgi:hypothetical protein
MCLTLIYGYYVFFIESASTSVPSPTNTRLDSFNKFITQVSELTRKGLSDADMYVIDRISTKWTKDPLLTTLPSISVASNTQASSSNEGPTDLNYSGFLQMGRKNMAIINGVEYEKGEELISGDYTIRSITPLEVVLIKKGANKTVTIPLIETP